jgi:hypothetical protein
VTPIHHPSPIQESNVPSKALSLPLPLPLLVPAAHDAATFATDTGIPSKFNIDVLFKAMYTTVDLLGDKEETTMCLQCLNFIGSSHKKYPQYLLQTSIMHQSFRYHTVSLN